MKAKLLGLIACTALVGVSQPPNQYTSSNSGQTAVLKIVVWAYIMQAAAGTIIGGTIPWLVWFGWVTPK